MGTWNGFNAIDALVAVFLVAGLIGGVRRGLSGELARAIIAVACIAVASLYLRQVADWAMAQFNLSARQSYVGALLALLLGTYAALTALRLVLGNLADFHFKGKLERAGGALCGLLRSAVVVSIVLLLLSLMPNDKLHAMITEDSFAGRFVCPRMRPVYESVSQRVPELRIPEPSTEPMEGVDITNEAAPAGEEDIDLGPIDAAPQ